MCRRFLESMAPNGFCVVERCAARPPSPCPCRTLKRSPYLKKTGTTGTNVVFPLQIKDLARAGHAKKSAQAPHEPSISGTNHQNRTFKRRMGAV